MPRSKLEDAAIEDALRTLPKWRRAGDTIARDLELASFREAQRVVNRIADAAEGADHHPDLSWVYRRLVIRLSTHDAGGITTRDIHLAHVIDDIVDA